MGRSHSTLGFQWGTAHALHHRLIILLNEKGCIKQRMFKTRQHPLQGENSGQDPAIPTAWFHLTASYLMVVLFSKTEATGYLIRG